MAGQGDVLAGVRDAVHQVCQLSPGVGNRYEVFRGHVHIVHNVQTEGVRRPSSWSRTHRGYLLASHESATASTRLSWAAHELRVVAGAGVDPIPAALAVQAPSHSDWCLRASARVPVLADAHEAESAVLWWVTLSRAKGARNRPAKRGARSGRLAAQRKLGLLSWTYAKNPC
jgi:hypothetical protein